MHHRAGYGSLAEFTTKNPKTVAAFQRAMRRATDEAVRPIVRNLAA